MICRSNVFVCYLSPNFVCVFLIPHFGFPPTSGVWHLRHPGKKKTWSPFIHSLIQPSDMHRSVRVTPGEAPGTRHTMVRKLTCLSSQRASARGVEIVISSKPHRKQCTRCVSRLHAFLSVSSMEMIFCPYC